MDDLSWAWLSVAIGLVLLVGGGELLVRGASRLATAVRISPLVSGWTVVASGTSAPEPGVLTYKQLERAAIRSDGWANADAPSQELIACIERRIAGKA
jgi:cation:H+ antiporter